MRKFMRKKEIFRCEIIETDPSRMHIVHANRRACYIFTFFDHGIHCLLLIFSGGIQFYSYICIDVSLRQFSVRYCISSIDKAYTSAHMMEI